jgi:asparagine synthase (glutamine-hydrolysing)
MCGIAGLVSIGSLKEREALTARMIRRISHRGPDASEIRSEGDVCFGHARLKVIDLSDGRQPMHRSDLQATIVLNGEIYNYIELREELEQRGHCFKTASDTEVLLVAYREWSSACVERLRGMFAFVIYDQASNSLFGARDRFGKKPLLYWHSGGQFAFASELKALLELSFVGRSVDPIALCAYLEQLYVPEQGCIFASINKLAPGHSFTWRAGEMRSSEYWKPHFQANPDLTFDEAVERLEKVLRDAVRIRLRSDVPLGLFLSGGVDSSLIAVMAAALLDRPLKTYSVRMAGLPDETPCAAQVAAVIDSDHTVIEVPEPEPDRLLTVAKTFDEPFADSSAVPMSMMAEVAKQYVTVILSGDGGDELFGGYGSYQGHATALAGGRPVGAGRSSGMFRAIRAKLPVGVEGGIRRIFPDIGTLIPATASVADEDILVRHCRSQQIHYEPTLKHLLRPEWRQLLGCGLREQRAIVDGSDDGLNRVFEYDVRTYLAGDILKKVDMTTMAWGLEARAPLLDAEVAALSTEMLPSMKVNGSETKRPLKKLLAARMGDEFVSRTKMGFGAPVARWLNSPAMRTVVSDLFESSQPRSGSWIEPQAMRDLMRRFYQGRTYLAQPLWTLLMLEVWGGEYL